MPGCIRRGGMGTPNGVSQRRQRPGFLQPTCQCCQENLLLGFLGRNRSRRQRWGCHMATAWFTYCVGLDAERNTFPQSSGVDASGRTQTARRIHRP
ncbi:hypothetical protein BDV24DRAFT_138996 [Aspergillus arachidicola]|uniref:Uncharacterized protein n=1 Tax=Aspergillus arachidicola TaxID=656916 RepID=A0A5N6XZC7_9EURO|nr:hypothetical protein BDV24DRAFT_138996 [Aspergillus arachidicola]